MVDNHPSARVKPKGKGVVIDHKSHGYTVLICPTWLFRLAVLHAMATVL